MQRKDFIRLMATLPLTAATMNLKGLHKLVEIFNPTEKMPVLFLGHGSPMNAIEENEFVAGFRAVAKTIPKPNAILCVSAHWETRGTFVTAMEHPRTIHDFGGFPKELYEVQYPAPGSPELARETQNLITSASVGLDDKWGLDHGAWSVIKHLYPDADVPVIQLSLDHTKGPKYHYELAQELFALRERGSLIIGSGNMVHNLRMVEWRKLNEPFAFDWALEASDKMKKFILDDNHQDLIDYTRQGREFQLAIPTPEHYLPMLYALALKNSNDQITLFNDQPVGGSLTMTSLMIGS